MLGIISDIHGNFTALEAVLEGLQKQKVTEIICLGDVIEGGPQPLQVLRKLQNLEYPVILGNADEEVVDAEAPRDYRTEFERILHDIDKWTLSQLSSRDIEFIRKFNPTIEIPLLEGKTLLCFHGSPRSNREGIFPTSSDEQLTDIFANVKATIMACGHTHTQMFRRYLDRTIVNPGSVGMPFQFATLEASRRKEGYNPAFAEYVILDYANDSEMNFRMCRAAVDLDKLVLSIRNSGMPHSEFAAKDWRKV